jgi:hypothetical protein
MDAMDLEIRTVVETEQRKKQLQVFPSSPSSLSSSINYLFPSVLSLYSSLPFDPNKILQEIVHDLTSTCFDKCVKGTSFSGDRLSPSDRTCLANCVHR